MSGRPSRLLPALRCCAGVAAVGLLHACAAPLPRVASAPEQAPAARRELKAVPVDYHVGNTLQFGTIYEPLGEPPGEPLGEAGGEASTRRPAVVLLHGGFFGDDQTTDAVARALAQKGVLAAFPAYRGEPRGLDGARGQGQVEFCEGEVRDGLTLVRLLRTRPDVDPERIAVLGFSHGGCISLRMLAEDPKLRAGVLFSPLSDAPDAARHMDQHPMQMTGFAGWLGARLLTYVARDPRPPKAAWAARSPVLIADSLRAPLLILHGTTDPLIPLQQTCRLRDALWRSGRPIKERLLSQEGLPALPAAQNPDQTTTQTAAAATEPATPTASTPATAPAPDRPQPGTPSPEVEDPQAVATRLPCGPLPPRPAAAKAPPAASAPPAEFWYLTDQGHLLSQPCKQRVEAMALQVLLTLLR